MNRTVLDRCVWSAGLWLCGWVTHEQFASGKAIGLSLTLGIIVWLQANFPASRKETTP